MKTKRAQILALAARGKSTWDIARIVYALPPHASHEEMDRKAAYVRVVLRQRRNGEQSAADRRYRSTDTYRAKKLAAFKEKYHSDPAFRARHLAHCAATYARKRAEAA